MSAFRIYIPMATGAVLLAVAVTRWMRSRRKSPQDLERERRERLSTSGRICDGIVLDVHDIQSNGHGAQQLIVYSYEIGGVSYEASQDITHLRQFIDVHSCKLGLHTSVRYDGHNPGNSIVISETWTGLRT